MGNFLYGGKRPTSITYQGKDVQTLKYNGVVVWKKFVLEPVTKTFSTWGGPAHREYYTAPVGATVMWVKRNQYNRKPIAYIKINQQQRFYVTMQTVGGNGSYYTSINLYKDGYVGDSSEYMIYSSANQTTGEAKMELSFSEEINNHDFNDSTSDHEHLDWTK